MVNVSSWAANRFRRILFLTGLLIPAVAIWLLWYAVNSDRDDIPPILTQLIPAGHCACSTSTVFECSSCLEQTLVANDTALDSGNWNFENERDGRNLGLTDGQCESAFPGLYEDVNLGEKYWTSKGPIKSKTLDDIRLLNGMTRAMIYDGNLYVIASKSKGEDHRRKILAVLSSMHRALATANQSPAAAGENRRFEFVFSIEDKASDVISGHDKPLWVVARKADEQSFWLIPDFGYWAWDNVIRDFTNEIGPYDEVVSNALEVEKGLSFSQKQPKLVWRGKLSFAPKLRRPLIEQSRGHEWSDVKEINWSVRQNFVRLEDHCKYQFIAHVEGRSYSASLKYRQACDSVIVTHKLQYIQHHHYLLQAKGPLQNYVEVQRDFTDLPDKMSNLLDNPAKAEKIASNSVKTFRERYLTPAADACYWRSLWKGYGKVSEPAQLWTSTDDGKRHKRGLRFESFVMLPSNDMLNFEHAKV